MQSSKFGPPAWNTMFTFAFGYYLNPEKCEIKDNDYINFFKLFGKTLPCKYCRDSYSQFFEFLQIRNYLKQDFGLVRFVYDLKNLVNNKLKSQEERQLQKEFTELQKTYQLNDPVFWKFFRDKAHKVCFTKPAPSFQSVLENLKMQRADCSSIEKHCRTPLSEEKQNDNILRGGIGSGVSSGFIKQSTPQQYFLGAGPGGIGSGVSSGFIKQSTPQQYLLGAGPAGPKKRTPRRKSKRKSSKRRRR
jgi:hypothetical protein